MTGADNQPSVKPRLLDLFCGAGGAAMGYHRAGFDVVGVDIAPQPRYPFTFVQADAMTYDLAGFDAIHASPPCQAYTGWQNIAAARGATNTHPTLIAPIRDRLTAAGLPYVIENVSNAPIRTLVVLCGTGFGLGVERHRKFESNVLLMGVPYCRHTGTEVGVYGKLDGRRLFTRVDGSELRNPATLEHASAAMGIDWMDWDELREAIPPEYTEWIGLQLLASIEAAA